MASCDSSVFLWIPFLNQIKRIKKSLEVFVTTVQFLWEFLLLIKLYLSGFFILHGKQTDSDLILFDSWTNLEKLN